MENIRAAFRSISFDGVANDFTFRRSPTGPVVIPDPAPIEIPSHLQAHLRIVETHVGKRKPSNVVKKLSIGAQLNLTEVSDGGRIVLFGESDGPALLDAKGIALFDAVEEIFSHHSLRFLPILRSDGVAGLQIDFASPQVGD